MALKDQRLFTATLLMIAAALLSAADTLLVRILTQESHPFVIVFFRSVFGLLFILPWSFRGRTRFRTQYSWLHITRAGLKFLSLVLFFLAIAAAPLADVTAIAFTTPVFVAVGAWVFLGEKATMGRFSSIVLGFAGVVLILHPGQGMISVNHLYAIVGAILAAIIYLILKHMSAHDSTETLVAWNLIIMVPLSSLPLYWFWATPTWQQTGLLALQGVIGAFNMAVVSKALSLADVSSVIPIDFLRLPIVAVFAYLFYAEVISVSTIAGASIIILSTLLITYPIRFSFLSR